uniref:Hexosyltransferase n=2 Tax=Aegilops tauschii subsp. strangulata TaxID=200361 RepID=A0A453SYB0_AEGTS
PQHTTNPSHPSFEAKREIEQAMAPMPKRIVKDEQKKAAYVTFLAGSGDYWMGVVGLAKGLRAVKSAYPLVVAVLPDVPEDHRRKLVEQGCLVREIEPVYPPESQTQFAMAYYVINYSKLRIWKFVEYERMVYLDADIQSRCSTTSTTSSTSTRAASTPSWTASARRRGATRRSTRSDTASSARTGWRGRSASSACPRRRSTSTRACSCTSPASPPPRSSSTGSSSPTPRPSPSRTSSTCSSGTCTSPSRRCTTSCSPCSGGTPRTSSSRRSRSSTTAQRVRSRGGTPARRPTWTGRTSRCS